MRFVKLMLILITTTTANASLGNFEDLTLPAESYWNGADGTGGFTSGTAFYKNNYDPNWGSWDGWAYSNISDNTTPGYTNQYGAITGTGFGGGGIYGIAWDSNAAGFGGNPPTIELTDTTEGYTLDGAYFTNTTYAYLSMQDGDAFAKKFGGPDGNDPDWFLLEVVGIKADDSYTENTVEFYLADFRFEDNSEDYILDEWSWVNLGALGNVTGLEFRISSSDTSMSMLNTPAYFAMDVPEPATLALLGLGVLMLRKTKRHLT